MGTNLIITKVIQGSQASNKGVTTDMKLYRINGVSVRTDREAIKALHTAHRTKEHFCVQFLKRPKLGGSQSIMHTLARQTEKLDDSCLDSHTSVGGDKRLTFEHTSNNLATQII